MCVTPPISKEPFAFTARACCMYSCSIDAHHLHLHLRLMFSVGFGLYVLLWADAANHSFRGGTFPNGFCCAEGR